MQQATLDVLHRSRERITDLLELLTQFGLDPRLQPLPKCFGQGGFPCSIGDDGSELAVEVERLVAVGATVEMAVDLGLHPWPKFARQELMYR